MTTTLKLWFSTIKTTVTNLGALIVFAILYVLLLGSAYIFISTREATVWQVLITYTLMILLPAEFFIFQASIIYRNCRQRASFADRRRRETIFETHWCGACPGFQF